MKRMPRCFGYWLCVLMLSIHSETTADEHGRDRRDRFGAMDVFELEYASDPQVSPDGSRIVYVRNFMDVMTDQRRSNLWIVNADGSRHRPLTSGNRDISSPRFSPDGNRIAYISSSDGQAQIHCRWMDTGEEARLTNLTSKAANLTWSPDGRWLAFTMLVPDVPEPLVKMPDKPEGAEWAEPLRVIRKVNYRFDGEGYLKDGYHHLFLLPADGGTARQLTDGPYHHRERPAWTPDGKAVVFSANRNPDWQFDPRNSDLYELEIASGHIRPLTDRHGPDTSPAVSPDGKQIAYVGYDDRLQGYQVSGLYVMNCDGGPPRLVTERFDRGVEDPVWSRDGKGIYIQYDDRGTTKVGFVSLEGEVVELAENVGGTSIGRPYASGSFSVGGDGVFAFTHSQPEHPADVAVGRRDGSVPRRLTMLNEDLLAHKTLGEIEELWYDSFDGRKIQGWIVRPPGFDANKKYPLILEIHGGPFANYGARFSAEVQLYAAAGYVVLYTNPRGSTGYGEEFGNLIHHAYPGHDYDDLMAGVDTLVASGYVDPARLFVTGGSGGGILTSWIVGKTGRFRAAVAAKPVINWYSFALTTDAYPYFYKYWFPGPPWEHAEHYLKRSPLSLVGNVTTPTMLLTGEVDYRTPISESEQFYQALKLRKIDTALVRVPGASHGIASRPSLLIAKVAHILKWFAMHDVQK